MSSILQSLLATWNANTVTDVFLGLLLVVFLLSLVLKALRKAHAFTVYTPTALTSLGILGTFVGIVIGLMEFNPAEIDDSIELLLAGLKTAFITSLSGMFLSIFYKVILAFGLGAEKLESGETADDIGPGEMFAVLKAQLAATESLQQTISGDDDSSLVSTIKLVRSDINDNHKVVRQQAEALNAAVAQIAEMSRQQEARFDQFQERLWRQMQEFADTLSKSATEQVIEALKQVIQDFNNNLTEQFGENFKQLNEACLKLVEWQEQYKGQLADMGEKYALGVRSIGETEVAVKEISVQTQVIPQSMQELRGVLQVNQHQLAELERHLSAFQDIRDKAVEAVPTIGKQIDMAIEGAIAANEKLAEGMKAGADQFQEVLKASSAELGSELKQHAQTIGTTLVEGSQTFKDNVDRSNGALIEASQATTNSTEKLQQQFEDALADLNNNFRNMFDELSKQGQAIQTSFGDAAKVLDTESKQSAQAFSQNMDAMRNELGETIRRLAEEHKNQSDRTLSALDGNITKIVEQTAEAVKKEIGMVDSALEQELANTMNSLGQKLATITGQFTRDYEKLTKQMQAVINQQVA